MHHTYRRAAIVRIRILLLTPSTESEPNARAFIVECIEFHQDRVPPTPCNNSGNAITILSITHLHASVRWVAPLQQASVAILRCLFDFAL
eukprot:4141648-Amphidinium_carterae.1